MAARQKTAQQRQLIIETTDELLYQKGFNMMSFSDIAQASGVPRGNIYYYFKTKDEVLEAVIAHRIAQMKNMLAEWEAAIDNPVDRLKRYTQIIVNENTRVIRYGCPMGSLTSELGKSQANLKKLGKAQFEVFRKWLIKQFKLLQLNGNAEDMAMHLLVHTQGIASMAYVYTNRQLITREVEQLNNWLDNLG